MSVKAPFPYFGGKSRIASAVWERFGDVDNYVEPFCGSAAVLLARPTAPRIETVNDANCFIANFWRAVKHDPEAAAHHADWPVNEADLHARHRWLMLSDSSAEWRERMKTDPDYFDAKIAGWWVWGASCWIGAGWCDGGRLFGRDGGASNKKPEIRGGRGDTAARRQIPDLTGDSGAAGRGIHSSALHKKIPAVETAGNGIHRKIPELCSRRGDASALSQQVPHLTGFAGVHRQHLSEQIPELTSSRGDTTAKAIEAWFLDLADRLRRVRVVCGDWARVVTPAVTTGIGATAILLDPPYSDKADRTPNVYGADDDQVAHRVREWAISNGDNPLLRIALCGYEGEHDMPSSWGRLEWAAAGGYANQKKGEKGLANRLRERIWFSPHCLSARQGSLMELA